jgi:hypothetical protein
MENTYKICIPHPNSVLDADLAHKKTVHPPEGELHELNAFHLQVRRERSFGSAENHNMNVELNHPFLMMRRNTEYAPSIRPMRSCILFTLL